MKSVLTQFIDGAERVIAYASRTMGIPERNFTVTEQECLSVLWAVRKFRPYTERYPFEIITDHSSLRWLCNLKHPTDRLGSWATELLGNQVTTMHRNGVLHHVPDALSRIYETEAASAITETDDPRYLRRIKNVHEMTAHFPKWKVEGGYLYCHRPDKFSDSIFPEL